MFKVKNNGITPYNPLEENRQMYNMKRETHLNAGPLTIPVHAVQAQVPSPFNPMNPNNQFLRLRALLMGNSKK